MQESLALLEQDFTEMREFTTARLSEHSLSWQLRDEVCQVKREQGRSERDGGRAAEMGHTEEPCLHHHTHRTMGQRALQQHTAPPGLGEVRATELSPDSTVVISTLLPREAYPHTLSLPSTPRSLEAVTPCARGCDKAHTSG
ncbi:hypothetical protein AAFF_G00137890 [Aldrovandia affinis]|uniref:Uncharacterized protein n=1 Tax=Aldrovandia affinis TaxID=143900 RepID=A0AAD7X2P1_9TELE|nr:hypothetical protein AAFF_G00137890 [Aldrovandia affinis]